MLRRRPIPDDHPDASADFAERTVTEVLPAAQRRELVEAVRWLEEDDQQLLSLWWQRRLPGHLRRVRREHVRRLTCYR